MSSSAHAYDYYASAQAADYALPVPERFPDHEHEYTTSPRPQIREVPAKKTAAANKPGFKNLLLTTLITTIVLVVAVSAVFAIRVAIGNVAFADSMKVKQLKQEISELYDRNFELASEYAMLANSAAVKEQALKLGMVPTTAEILAANTELNEQALADFQEAINQREALLAQIAESQAASKRAAEAANAANAANAAAAQAAQDGTQATQNDTVPLDSVEDSDSSEDEAAAFAAGEDVETDGQIWEDETYPDAADEANYTDYPVYAEADYTEQDYTDYVEQDYTDYTEQDYSGYTEQDYSDYTEEDYEQWAEQQTWEDYE